jgi:CDP-diacylglycerol--glycerol-3-phosphate 3-phosphatidyltransferase
MPSPTRLQSNLPNALTLLRVALAALFVAVIALRTRPFPTGDSMPGGSPDIGLLLAGALFVVAALTDALDGHLARTWNVISKFGRIMDPFADKVLVLGAFIMLAGPAFTTASGHLVSGIAPWMVVVMLARELLVTSIRAALEGDGIDFSAGWSGKIKMALQSLVVPLILILLAWGAPARGSARAWTIDIAAWATVGATVLSGVPYLTRAIAANSKPKITP